MNKTWAQNLPGFIRKRIEGRHDLQRAIGNTGWLFADNILRMGVGLLVSVRITRYLGPEQFGILSYASAFVFIFSSITTLGLDWVVVRNIVREPLRRDEILGSAFVLKLLGGAVTYGLTLACIALLRPAENLTQSLVAIIALGMIFQAFGTIGFYFQSQVKSKFVVYAKNTTFLFISICKVGLVSLHAPLIAFAWAGLAEIALGSIGLMIAYRASGHHLKAWRMTRTMAKELLHDSWPLMLTDIAMLAYMRIDQIILGEIVGNVEVGIYAVAVLLAETWYFIPMAVTSSVFPSIVEAKGCDEELFHDRLQKYFNLMAFLGYAVAIPVTLIAKWAISFLYGPAYSAAAPMLIGLTWAGLFINLTIARSSFLTAMNWTRLHFLTDFMGLMVNIALNLILIPRFGGMGAVIASLFAYWFVAHGSCFLFKQLFRTGNMLTKALIHPRFW